VIELTVEPSDRIILYTDGIIEAMNPRGDMYGSKRFMELVMENRDVSAQELTDIILGQLFKWTGRSRSLDDDFSLVVVDIK
jgi:phosphoserine phosphatase RsbU/P